jgi:hypothetical protein
MDIRCAGKEERREREGGQLLFIKAATVSSLSMGGDVRSLRWIGLLVLQ